MIKRIQFNTPNHRTAAQIHGQYQIIVDAHRLIPGNQRQMAIAKLNHPFLSHTCKMRNFLSHTCNMMENLSHTCIILSFVLSYNALI